VRHRDVPEIDKVGEWLRANEPKQREVTLTHGDYKLDNVMLAAERPDTLAGVFDWEMSAIGDPLVDVGILLCYWVHTASADDAVGGVTARPGWFGREKILERYAARSGRALDAIQLYEVFAVFKLAVVIQQIYARYVRGQTDDPRFGPLGERVTKLARIATELAMSA
jgi:aminoglycoside phosphotransferase (APT) family kinase protein